MARIAGIDIPKQKRGVIALTYIFGIGKSRAQEILEKAEVSEDTQVSDWTDDEIGRIRNQVQSYTIEGELRSETQINIKRLMDIGCYRGIRHRSGLPLRGQRTKNNSRTRKGKRNKGGGTTKNENEINRPQEPKHAPLHKTTNDQIMSERSSKHYSPHTCTHEIVTRRPKQSSPHWGTSRRPWAAGENPARLWMASPLLFSCKTSRNQQPFALKEICPKCGSDCVLDMPHTPAKPENIYHCRAQFRKAKTLVSSKG